MLVSHEIPLQILEQSKQFNDYEFILPYYYIRFKEYKKFYLKNINKNNRISILDCGLFEGEILDDSKLKDIINELQPTYFIIPDKWNDVIETKNNAIKWMKWKDSLPTKLMAVIQCTDLEIGTKLYKDFIDLGVEAIAFNHSSVAYKDLFPHNNINVSKMMGRIQFINYLNKNNIINHTLYHHLLGCNMPDEFKYYGEGYEFIKSVDTSNPIIWGCQGKYYDIHTETSKTKPPEKIETYFEQNITPDQISAIEYNIRQFKKYLND